MPKSRCSVPFSAPQSVTILAFQKQDNENNNRKWNANQNKKDTGNHKKFEKSRQEFP